MFTKSQYVEGRGAAVCVSSRVGVCNSKKCVFSLARKLDSELALRMSFGSKFQTFGAVVEIVYIIRIKL